MSAQQAVLVVGGTGRTGRRVIEELLRRGLSVRAIVRSRTRLPGGVVDHPHLSIVEADLLSLGDADLVAHVRGHAAVISCLGHTITLKGVFGPPRDLVTRATTRLCQAIRDSHPAAPVRYILMSSVSVHHPGAPDTRRRAVESGLVWLLRGLVPPARDNQRAADFLHREVGTRDPSVQWVVVRPDSLLDGEASPFTLHEHLVNSLFSPGTSTMANIATFMGDLATDAATWNRWAGHLPVIVNAT